ncbi:rpmG [Symbiodinium pilosum]|uniref:RpmG protein n=1 Tax=Symbiodinium pilosum TaxID=2952 RepID=A0A812UIU9_SYMPI|nr:rpmG [Symbiodinium pilosum]
MSQGRQRQPRICEPDGGEGRVGLSCQCQPFEAFTFECELRLQVVSSTPTSWRAEAKPDTWPGATSASSALAAAVFVGASFARAVSSERLTSLSMAAHRKPTKKGRKLCVIECVEQRQMVKDGVPGAGGPRGGVSRYYTEKNVRNTPELLKLRKFNKYLGRHTLHVELK